MSEEMIAGVPSSRSDYSEDYDQTLLTTVEAARVLQLSPRSLERYRVSGEGPMYVKIGPGKNAPVRYRAGDLDNWLGKFRYESTSEYIE